MRGGSKCTLLVLSWVLFPAPSAGCSSGGGAADADSGESADPAADPDAAEAGDPADLSGDDPPAEPSDVSPEDPVEDEDGPLVLEAQNPVIEGDHPDPHVMRVEGADGRPVYYLVATVHNGGDIPIYTSRDLVHWEMEDLQAFGRPRTPGASMDINGAHYCSIWAPQMVQLGPSSFLLSFSAQRFSSPQNPCPPYGEDGGVYLAWSSSPLGPFAPAEHPWEPLPAGGHITDCPYDVRDAIPHSVDWASPDCQGNYCHKIVRLDSDVFMDPATGRWWMTYSWYTNSPPMVPWEETNYGEHTSIVELDPSDPFTVICSTEVAQIHAANPHDAATLERLRSYCPRCGEMLSMVKGRFEEDMWREGFLWGVVEGGNLFRRGGYVYILLSGSAWDSSYYHVYWAAAPSVEELVYGNENRLVGRYLIPGDGQAFGHGTVTLGPDGETFYYVHHRLVHQPCRDLGQCQRDVWVSPIRFEDRGDGLGDVYIAPRFPAEDSSFSVVIP